MSDYSCCTSFIMAGKIVKVLGKYRASEDPELGNNNESVCRLFLRKKF